MASSLALLAMTAEGEPHRASETRPGRCQVRVTGDGARAQNLSRHAPQSINPVEIVGQQRRRRTEPRAQRRAERPRPRPSLLPAAMQDRVGQMPVAHPQGADTFRTVNLVGGHGDQKGPMAGARPPPDQFTRPRGGHLDASSLTPRVNWSRSGSTGRDPGQLARARRDPGWRWLVCLGLVRYVGLLCGSLGSQKGWREQTTRDRRGGGRLMARENEEHNGQCRARLQAGAGQGTGASAESRRAVSGRGKTMITLHFAALTNLKEPLNSAMGSYRVRGLRPWTVLGLGLARSASSTYGTPRHDGALSYICPGTWDMPHQEAGHRQVNHRTTTLLTVDHECPSLLLAEGAVRQRGCVCVPKCVHTFGTGFPSAPSRAYCAAPSICLQTEANFYCGEPLGGHRHRAGPRDAHAQHTRAVARKVRGRTIRLQPLQYRITDYVTERRVCAACKSAVGCLRYGSPRGSETGTGTGTGTGTETDDETAIPQGVGRLRKREAL